MSTPAVEARTPNTDAGESYMNLAIRTAAMQAEATNEVAAATPVVTTRRARSNAARGIQAAEERTEEHPAENSSNINENPFLNADLAQVEVGDEAVGGLNLQRPHTPLLRIKLSELSTSSSDSEGDNTQQSVAEADLDANGDPRRAVSPPPNCAICLGRCKNKCFTDSCMHQFCFKCLCEWSKVKPECPLCKQTFKSIIHNVKSIDQFEEYLVQPPTVQIPHRPIEVTYRGLPHIFDGVVLESPNWDTSRRNVITNTHRIRPNPGIYYSSLLPDDNANNVGGNGVRNQFLHRSELLDMYRQEAPDAIVNSGTLSQLWRRFIYDRRLYALPVCDITGRFRECSARYYRDNPAQVHRLMPWINRDIVCLLRNTEHDVSALMELINENLLLTNIISPAFRRRLQPYLGSKTSHFIHELHNFARSPYDMIGYDRAVHYLPQAPEEIVIEFSSSASSEEDNATGGTEEGSERVRSRSNNRSARTTGGYRVQSRSGNTAGAQQPMVNLLSFTISTTSEGAEAPGVTVAVSGRGTQSAAINLTTHNRASDDIIDLDESEALYEAGTSNAAAAVNTATSDPALDTESTTNATSTQAAPVTVTENIELTSSSSDECEFVLERKPPHLRTPELVSLHSESDSDVVFVEETKPLHKTTYSTSEDEAESQKGTKEQSTSAGAHSNATQELYNIGASTSTGLRSSGGGRGYKQIYEKPSRSSVRQSKRKRSLRSAKEDSSGVRGGRSYKDISSTSSSSTTSSSESDDEEYEMKRRRTRSRRNCSKKRSTLPKRASQKDTNPNSKITVSNTNSRKRGHAKNKKQKQEFKKCKFEIKTSDTNNSSDESQNLIELRKRLIALKDERGEQINDESSQNNSIFNEMPHPKCEPAAAEDSNSACLPPETADFSGRTSDPIDIMTNFENVDSNQHNEASLQSDNSNQISELAEEDEGAQCFRLTPTNTTELQVEHNVTIDEENTFSSVTQTTTATNTTSTNRHDRSRSHSRTSVHSFNSNSSLSTRSTHSTTSSISSPSMCTASSGAEEEEDTNDAENEACGTNLRMQQLLDSASLNESWIVNEMDNNVAENEEQENCEANNETHRTLHTITPPPQVVDAVALPDIENDVSGIFLSHDANLVLSFNYGPEVSQSDTEHNDDVI